MKFLGMSVSFLLVGSVACAVELPVRYKAGALNVVHRKNTENWVSTLNVRYSSADAREGFDKNSERASALDILGHTDVVRLGFGLRDLVNTKITTFGNWKLGYVPEDLPLPAPVPPPGILDIRAENPVKLTGRVAGQEVALSLVQNLFSGFFLQAHLPFRSLTVDKISYEIIGPQNFPAGGSVKNFMDNELPVIMREQGMESLFSSYKKQGLSEAVLGLGWQGFNDKGFGVINDATGRVFVGAIIPGAGKKDQAYATGLPLGYDGFFGVHTRIELEVGLHKYFGLGAASSVSIFFTETRNERVMSDYGKKQQGLLAFEVARVGVDQGPVWDAAAYAKMHKVFYGLNVTIGYSFSRQEDTRFAVKDDTYLAAIAARYSQQIPPRFLNQNDIANNDQRLRAWERQALYFIIGYDFGLHPTPPPIAPAIFFEYGYPLDGRRIVSSKYLGGSASLQLKFGF